MQPSLEEAKAALRREVRPVLKSLSSEERARDSERARELLQQQVVWIQARSLLFYAPMPEEVDIWPLLTTALESGKQAALPRYDPQTDRYTACQIRDLDRDLKAGRFGIREPSDHCAQLSLIRLDLILVPGLAFDLHGRRLGRGRGYYDQMLAVLRGPMCGVAFDRQIVPEIPVAPHDALVNCILTPTRWLELNSRAVLK